MIKTAAVSLLSAMALTTAVRVDPAIQVRPHVRSAYVFHVHPPLTDSRANAVETIAVYYSPLASTKVTRLVGFGMAYHMAIVYTDRAGGSYGASSGPSDNSTPQTPANALRSIADMAGRQPSSFGTLVADPLNDHVFVKDSSEDYYTKDREGRAYPHALVTRGKDLSARWVSILRIRRRRPARPNLFAVEPELKQPGRDGASERGPRAGLLQRDRFRARPVHAAADELSPRRRPRTDPTGTRGPLEGRIKTGSSDDRRLSTRRADTRR